MEGIVVVLIMIIVAWYRKSCADWSEKTMGKNCSKKRGLDYYYYYGQRRQMSDDEPFRDEREDTHDEDGSHFVRRSTRTGEIIRDYDKEHLDELRAREEESAILSGRRLYAYDNRAGMNRGKNDYGGIRYKDRLTGRKYVVEDCNKRGIVLCDVETGFWYDVLEREINPVHKWDRWDKTEVESSLKISVAINNSQCFKNVFFGEYLPPDRKSLVSDYWDNESEKIDYIYVKPRRLKIRDKYKCTTEFPVLLAFYKNDPNKLTNSLYYAPGNEDIIIKEMTPSDIDKMIINKSIRFDS